MLKLQKILTFFSALADIPEQEALRWAPLCENAAAYICGRLRCGVKENPAPHMQRLCMAAAACACNDYRQIKAAGGGEEVRVGAVHIKPVAGAYAQDPRDKALLQVADLLEPEGFVFRQVEP